MVEGMKIALAMSETKAFKAVGSKLWDKVAMPGTQYPYLQRRNCGSVPLLYTIRDSVSNATSSSLLGCWICKPVNIGEYNF
jgi:hypothetical protein